MQRVLPSIDHLDAVFIGGSWYPATGTTRDVRSPVDGAYLASVTAPSIADAMSAVEAADAVREAWGRTPLTDRVAACGRWLELVDARAAELDDVWATEAGMPVRHGKAIHRYATVPAWRAALDGAADVLDDQHLEVAGGRVLVRRDPVGVVVAILPYNGPVLTVASKVIPALLAGCPVVVKAAPESHLTMAVVAECARQAGFPDGVLSVVTGDADVAKALTRDVRVDLVSLTGGHVAAQDVLAATRDRYARTQLELGGKSPAIVLDDADLTAVLRILVPGATNGAGQVCAALSRILVSENRHDEIVEALKAGWDRLIIGDPRDPATHVGPLIDERALIRTEVAVAEALADGARLVAGGGRPAGFEAGWYHEPTLFTDVAEESALAQNEVFGPVTAVQTYRDVDDAVRLANATRFGLSGAVFTADTAVGVDIASRIRSGAVAVNSLGPSMTAPFGGMKASGWGRESGALGIVGFTEIKQILVGA